MTNRPLPVLLSIHDVMPQTLDRVADQLEVMFGQDLRPVTLLIVPGRGWREAHLRRLRRWIDEGCELAGHGWVHRLHVRRKSPYHALHAAVLSRDAGEHLSLPPRKITALIKRNHRWFVEKKLPVPKLYVPPAWALGRLSRRTLDRLPYRYYELLHGVYDSERRKEILLPMAGYEADTALRAVCVRRWNRMNFRWCESSARPLRLGLHPDDFQLHLGEQALADLRRKYRPMSYRQLGTLYRA